MANTFLYFAYGSNMSIRRLQIRTPSAMVIDIARADGYKLVFDKRSKDGSGKADCEKTGDPSDFVMGGLFQIDEDQRSGLDAAEGMGKGYESSTIKVCTSTGIRKTLTYVATDKRQGLVPYGWYLDHVLIGGKELALADSYLRSLGELVSQADPDLSRDARERAIYIRNSGR